MQRVKLYCRGFAYYNIQAANCAEDFFWQKSLRPKIKKPMKAAAKPIIIPAPLKIPAVRPEKNGATIILLTGINSVNSEIPVDFTVKARRNKNKEEQR